MRQGFWPARSGARVALMSVALTYALAGMTAASTRVGIRAGNIANVATPGYQSVGVDQVATPSGPAAEARPSQNPVPTRETPPLSPETARSFFDNPSNVSLEREIVDMTAAKHAYKASALVSRTAGDMQDALLDMFS